MSYLGNSPAQELVIRLEARKSFALGIFVRDTHGDALDITDAQLRIVMRDPKSTGTDDSDNLILNNVAALVHPTKGYATFNLQATDLDHKPQEYPFSVIMLTEGYSIVVARGVVDLVQNTEYSSTASSYLGQTPPSSLEIKMRGLTILDVRTGPALAPGTTSFTDQDKDKLNGIEAGAQQNIPSDWDSGADDPGYILNKPPLGSAAYADVDDLAIPLGGGPGEVLVKLSSRDFDTAWQHPRTTPGSGGLDAFDIPNGWVPTADGVDGWGWKDPDLGVETVNGQTGDVVLDLSTVNDTAARVAMTPIERAKLAGLSATTEWDDVQAKPAFGSAALKNEVDFLKPTEVTTADVTSGVFPKERVPRLTEHRGFSSGTGVPSGGVDGDFYFQYTV